MKNNIFQFATSELSQDAFICWLANGFNCDNEQLKQLAIEFVQKVSGVDNVRRVEIYRQYQSIDVLLIVNDVVAVIIEDKTFTGEHDNQIERYKKVIQDDQKYSKCTVRTVFLKTGFMYDDDRATKQRVEQDGGLAIDRACFIEILSRYQGKCNSEILDDYYQMLLELDDKDSKKGQYYKFVEDSNSEWNISCYDIAQYKLMREFFPDEQNDYIYHGSSSGRPWTEHVIHKGKHEEYALFWRIDTDSKGPYVSLRVYPEDKCFNKNDNKIMEINLERYKRYSDYAKEYFEQLQSPVTWEWSIVYPGWRGGYREAAIITYHLQDALRDWNNAKDGVVQNIRRISEDLKKIGCEIDEKMNVDESIFRKS